MYAERARRSISVESRQASLVDYIAQFNDIPKKYEIKFDLTGFSPAQEDSENSKPPTGEAQNNDALNRLDEIEYGKVDKFDINSDASLFQRL